MNKTKIEWTDYTWNPVVGCSKISAGCRSCFAETLVNRFGKQWGMKNFNDVQMREDRLNQPIAMQNKLKGKKVFVCDMSDLFHEKVSDVFIIKVIQVIRQLPDTQFQILTKRIERFYYLIKNWELRLPRNLWVGISVENQDQFYKRFVFLKHIPASIKFLSIEPLIDEITLFPAIISGNYNWSIYPQIDWVIVGGETGRLARPMKIEWVKRIYESCKEAGVAYFFKQFGSAFDHSQQVPDYLTKREFPV